MKQLDEDQIANYLKQSSDDESQESDELSIEAYKGLWEQAEGLRKNYQPSPVEERWLELNKRKKKRFRNRMMIPWVSGIAACILLFIVYINFYRSVTPTLLSSVANPVFDQMLPDGSELSIMAQSEITFDANQKQRTLALSGGGYFEVAKDLEKPFVINTNQFQVEVLGTSFYVNDGTWGQPMVVVEEGLVNVRFKEHSVQISKGEAVVLDVQSGTYKRILISHHNFLAWKTGELNFDTTPIAEVVQVLEANFQTKLAFDETSQALLTASFKEENLENILYLIQRTLNLKIEKINE